MTFDEYFGNMYGKTVSVLGVGVSNMPLIRLLSKYGAIVTAFDKKPKEELDKSSWDELFHLSVPAVLGADYLAHIDADYIFRTPGLNPHNPQIVKAVERGAVLTSEMEVFFALCPCPIIAVTGSDGKTTTTTIISEMLKKAGKTVHLGGNIGTPLLDKVPQMESTHVAVVELSSFQLMTMKQSPAIGLITNIAPNHLDIHTDMAEYIAAKENIFLHQSATDKLVLNSSCPFTAAQAAKAPGSITLFSPHQVIDHGVCIVDDVICYVEDAVKTPLIPIEKIKLVGFHNVENYMAAVAVLWGLVPPADMLSVAMEFGGVEHRNEFVRTVNGVSYYNDSIASSPTRTIAGLHSFKQPVILIAGGSDKHIPFSGLADEIISHVKSLFLVGATAQAIRAAVTAHADYHPQSLPITLCSTLQEAVLAAAALANAGDIITMSPACASFDLYKNFMERGDLFKKIVGEL